ncbi:response regulator [Roseibium aggregatum]|uniref:Response regulator n=1 Tax=Roseibium aggregatum TaxID=187304 RepID=A0A939EA64_9HYPH|nr:response regulator [Roseibium aggregatum]MBN9669425.1 response regulator [Roseibium aggregatum]
MASASDTFAHRKLGPALIVEDNPIIAVDTQSMLEELGFSPVEILTSLSEGLETLADQIYNFVILDVKIGDDTSLRYAEMLLEKGTRFVFATGYSEIGGLPSIFQSHAVLPKPYTKDQIEKFI